MIDIQIIYILVLAYAFYAVIKLAIIYNKKRDSKYLMILLLLLILVSDLWMRAYGKRLENFFENFRFIITLVPVIAFLAWNHLESKRLKEEKDKLKVKEFFKRYVNPNVIEELLKKEKIELGGLRKNVTVFFSDVRGFTSMSESESAEKVIEYLNEHFNVATKIILKYNGTVDKFIGDAMMVFFNAPIEQKEHELNAVKAAIEIQKKFKELNKERKKKGKREFTIGIGINSGEAVIGNIGSSEVMDYTAIGDTVNVAARLQGQAKAGEIVISESVYNKVKDKIKIAKKFKAELKGKTKKANLYKVKIE